MNKIFLSFLIIVSFLSAQQKTNFEFIQTGLDSVVSKLTNDFDKNQDYHLVINSATEYSILTSSVKNNFSKKLRIVDEPNSNKIVFSINEIKTEYKDCFRDGIFGDFFTERVVNINSSYNIENIKESSAGNNSVFSLKDTIRLDEIEELENSAYSFTKSTKPEEPFISGLTEPIIVISAIAVSIYLLFSVRSN